MGGERVSITDGSSLGQLMQIPDFRSAVSGVIGGGDFTTGEVYRGFGSSGTVIEFGGGRLFLRVPEAESVGVCPERLLRDYYLSGNTGVRSIIVVSHAGDIKVKEYPADVAVEVDPSSVAQSGFGGGARYIAQLLDVLPDGVPLTQLIAEKPMDGASAYYALGEELGRLHGRELAISDGRKDSWRRLAVSHPIEGLERFDVVAGVIRRGLGEGWLCEERLTCLRFMMDKLANDQLTRGVKMTRIHGDAWRDNVWIRSGGGVQLFDNALAVGHPGYDLAFAMGDQLVAGLVTGRDEYQNRVRALLVGYKKMVGQEGLIEAFSEAFVPLAFKLVVGAAFDLGEDSNPARRQLIQLAGSLLEHKLNDPEAVFAYDLAQDTYGSDL